MTHCRWGAMHSHSPRIIPEMAHNMPVLGSIRNKLTWWYTCSPRPLGCGMPLGAVVMVEATSSTPTSNKEWGGSHQKRMAEVQSWFENIMTMTRNTTEQINHLDTRFFHQHEEYWQELKTIQADMRKAKADLGYVTSELRMHKTKILQMEQQHCPGKRIIEALEEPRDWSKECRCKICRTPEKIYLRLENKHSWFTFLVEHVDWQTWSVLKKFMERMINENFQQLPKPKRKRAKHTADEDKSRRHATQKDNDNAGEQTRMVNVTNTNETKTDYDDYSDLDPILPPEGSPRLVMNDEIVKIPGLEDLDWVRNRQVRIDCIRQESKSSAVMQRSTAEYLLPCRIPHHTQQTSSRKWRKKGITALKEWSLRLQVRSLCKNNQHS